jgi:SAM-dependent methyltransferase
LLPPEATILTELRDRLPSARMLDLGVGGGRTTRHFAPLVREYIGLDLSDGMVAACQAEFGHQYPSASFVVGDARDLSRFSDNSFDLVLFAFNGIDSVGDQPDRLRALSEIRRVCAPGGHFAVSTDNLLYARRTLSVTHALAELAASRPARTVARDLLSNPRRTVRAIRRPLRLRWANFPTRRLRKPHAMYVYVRHRYEVSPVGFTRPGERIRIDGYAIEPAAQVQQLEALGFRDIRILAMDGRTVTDGDNAELSRWQWLYYLCEKPGS